MPIASPHLARGERGDSRKRSSSSTSVDSKRRRVEKLSCQHRSQARAIDYREAEFHEDSDEGSVSRGRYGSEDLEGSGTSSMAVRVDDHEKIKDFIDLHFRLMQQTNCKTIAKAWISKREPQKQTTHPYNGRRKREGSSNFNDLDNVGESTKPAWWPPTEGWPHSGCRHREPDHIKKSGKDLTTCVYT